MPFPITTGRDHFYLCYLVVMNAASPDQVSYLGYVVPITHRFYSILSCSMMTHPLGYIAYRMYLVLYTCSVQSSVLLCVLL